MEILNKLTLALNKSTEYARSPIMVIGAYILAIALIKILKS